MFFLRKIAIPILSLFTTFGLVFAFVHAGTLNPGVGSVQDTQKTLEDIYCKITGCSAGNYGLDSIGNAAGTMHTLQQIYDAVFSVDYTKQKHQIYDDYNCSNNNSESNTACGAGDAEFTGEEAAWSSSTDTNLNGALVASGKVYKDTRTGLYWSDAYDAVSGAGSPDTNTNSFTVGSGCSDDQINSGSCDASMFQTKGNAMQFCLDLSLDSNGDSIDETDWRLPTQKEFLQAYIDGAGNNLPNILQIYWSATEDYSNTNNAWNVALYECATGNNGKNSSFYVRCVRP